MYKPIFSEMAKNFLQFVKEMLLDLECDIVYESAKDQVLVIEKQAGGIKSLVIGVAYPIVIIEQYILELNESNTDVYKYLLQKNREIVHGAFVLDETGKRVIFRDTLQIDNLDRNELEGSINSLGLLLSEYSKELVKYSK